MGSVTVEKSQPQMPHTDWFQSVSGSAIYKRGENGFCITESGIIVANKYTGDVYKVFDNPAHYTPLYPGDKIVITL
jgi:hypothetical protein